MKSRLCLIVVLFLIITTNSYAFGITPAVQEIKFDSDLKQDLSFKIMNTEHKDLELNIYSRGELEQYVNVKTKSIKMKVSDESAEVSFKLNIPYSVRKPGANLIEIIAEEKSSEVSKQTAIGAKIALIHQLMLVSPINGKYLDAKLTIPSLNSFEAPVFTYALSNLGSESIGGAYVEIEIFDESMHSFGLQRVNIENIKSGEKRKLEVIYKKNLIPGNYIISSVIYYGNEKIKEEIVFTVGGPYAEIEGVWASNFVLGQINEIGFSVRNMWSQKIENVNAEIIVTNEKGSVVGTFTTLTANLDSFASANLMGYWNTKSIGEGKYFLKAKLNYEGQLSERDFELFISENDMESSFAKISGSATTGKPKSFNPSLTTLLIAILILIMINVILFMYLRKKKDNYTGGI